MIAKLVAWRDKDQEDLKRPEMARAIDWAKLEALATAEDELKSNMLNEHNYRMFLENYKDYVEEWRPCGN